MSQRAVDLFAARNSIFFRLAYSTAHDKLTIIMTSQFAMNHKNHKIDINKMGGVGR